jgi:hypothetical protein
MGIIADAVLKAGGEAVRVIRSVRAGREMAEWGDAVKELQSGNTKRQKCDFLPLQVLNIQPF